MPEYVLVCLNKQGSEYPRVLSMPDIVYNLRLHCTRNLALIDTEACSEPSQTAKVERCERIIIPFN